MMEYFHFHLIDLLSEANNAVGYQLAHHFHSICQNDVNALMCLDVVLMHLYCLVCLFEMALHRNDADVVDDEDDDNCAACDACKDSRSDCAGGNHRNTHNYTYAFVAVLPKEHLAFPHSFHSVCIHPSLLQGVFATVVVLILLAVFCEVENKEGNTDHQSHGTSEVPHSLLCSDNRPLRCFCC